MKLRLSVPTQVVIDEVVTKIIAQSDNGHFCLLPRHMDFLAALVPGLLVYTTPDSEENYIAVDEGLLVKQADLVLVSARQVIRGGALGELQRRVDAEFLLLDERQKTCQSAIANLEANFLRGFFELEQERV